MTEQKLVERESFPKFEDEQHVYCWNCKLQITGPFQASNFAVGRGAWRGQCTGQHGCGKITYFDWAGDVPTAVSTEMAIDFGWGGGR